MVSHSMFGLRVWPFGGNIGSWHLIRLPCSTRIILTTPCPASCKFSRLLCNCGLQQKGKGWVQRRCGLLCRVMLTEPPSDDYRQDQGLAGGLQKEGIPLTPVSIQGMDVAVCGSQCNFLCHSVENSVAESMSSERRTAASWTGQWLSTSSQCTGGATSDTTTTFHRSSTALFRVWYSNNVMLMLIMYC